MSLGVFDATTILNQFHANLASIETASMGRFTRSPYRFSLEKEPESGPDGRYSVDLASVAPYDRKWGTGDNICTGVVLVRVAYKRPGGDLGGGDRSSVNRVAASDCMLIADVCENADNYNASATGISIVVFDGFNRVLDAGKTEVWETRFNVTFRSELHTSPVADLMVASIISESTSALSALSVLSLASGTGAVIPATATVDPQLWFLDKENLAGDSANGTTIIGATGVMGAVWRGGVVATESSITDSVDAASALDGMRVIETQTLTGEATTVSFTGLSDATYDPVAYVIHAHIIGGSGAQAYVYMRPNGVTTNMGGHLHYDLGGTPQATFVSSMQVGSTSTVGVGAGLEITFYPRLGRGGRIAFSRQYARIFSDLPSDVFQHGGFIWTDDTDPVTSIDLVASGANAFGIGSVFSLYVVREES